MDQKERRKLLGLLLINRGVFYIQQIKKRKKRRTWRSCWMKEWLIKRACNTIFKELHLNDQEYFRRYLRMNTEVYEVKFFKK